MIYKNLKILCTKKELFKLYLILFGYLFATLFEVVGIGSIPIFIMVITDVNSLNPYLPKFIPSDFLLGIDNKEIVFIGALILGLVFTIKNSYLMLLFYIQGKFVKDLRYSLTNKIFKYFINLPYDQYSSLKPGVIIRAVQNDVRGTMSYILSYMNIIRESLILTGIFFLLVFTNPLISIFAIATLGIPVIIFYYFYRSILKDKGKTLTNEFGKKYSIVEQSFGAIKETKILNRENYFINTLSKVNHKIERISFFSYLISVSPRFFLEVAALISVTSVAVLLTILERPSETIIPIISLLAVSAIRLIPGLNLITSSLTTKRLLQEPFDIIVEIVKKLNLFNEENLNNNFETISKNKSERNRSKKFSNNIKFRDVSYNYPGSKNKAVKDISIEISKGTSVGIIGRSGSGKSTLVDIILGLLKPKSGEIIIDGENVDKEKNIWHTQIGYVPQNIYILDDTIKKNIIFGINEEDVDDNLLSEVIEMAQLKSLVSSLPDNINSLVGNGGAKLSGGERQRIGIARALYNKPDIMVLDEATSSLDMDNENKILSEIYQNKKDKTLIIISHRNNTVKYCDSIYVMENGKVIDDGSFQKIMKKYSYLSEDERK